MTKRKDIELNDLSDHEQRIYWAGYKKGRGRGHMKPGELVLPTDDEPNPCSQRNADGGCYNYAVLEDQVARLTARTRGYVQHTATEPPDTIYGGRRNGRDWGHIRHRVPYHYSCAFFDRLNPSVTMIRRSWMTGISIETTLELWASSLRAVKARMAPLFTQERVAASAGLFLDGLLGGERRKTGWMRAE